jgi:hypothetical protein
MRKERQLAGSTGRKSFLPTLGTNGIHPNAFGSELERQPVHKCSHRRIDERLSGQSFPWNV